MTHREPMRCALPPTIPSIFRVRAAALRRRINWAAGRKDGHLLPVPRASVRQKLVAGLVAARPQPA